MAEVKEIAKQTLHEITNDYQALNNLLEEFEGDISDENAVLAFWMKEIAENLSDKVDRYGYVIDQFDGRASQLRAMGQEFHRAAKSLENHIDGMKNAIKISMGKLGLKSIEGKQMYKFTLANSKSSLIIDESELPKEYIMQVISQEVDKEMIQKDLKAGKVIPGVTEIENKALRKGVKK